MSRFMTKPSSEYRAAVDAIASLYSIGDANAAYAEAVSPLLLEEVMTGLRRAAHPCVERLITRAPNHCAANHRCAPPGTDHPSLWLRHGKPVVFVSQPYDLDGDTLRELLAFCDARSLHLHLSSSRSWHYPGKTLLVAIFPESVRLKGKGGWL